MAEQVAPIPVVEKEREKEKEMDKDELLFTQVDALMWRFKRLGEVIRHKGSLCGDDLATLQHEVELWSGRYIEHALYPLRILWDRPKDVETFRKHYQEVARGLIKSVTANPDAEKKRVFEMHVGLLRIPWSHSFAPTARHVTDELNKRGHAKVSEAWVRELRTRDQNVVDIKMGGTLQLQGGFLVCDHQPDGLCTIHHAKTTKLTYSHLPHAKTLRIVFRVMPRNGAWRGLTHVQSEETIARGEALCVSGCWVDIMTIPNSSVKVIITYEKKDVPQQSFRARLPDKIGRLVRSHLPESAKGSSLYDMNSSTEFQNPLSPDLTLYESVHVLDKTVRLLCR